MNIQYLGSGAAPSSSGEGVMLDLLWAEERGNAHAETMRLREQGKRMARFIHYFTRFVPVLDRSVISSKKLQLYRILFHAIKVSSSRRKRQDGNKDEVGDGGSHHIWFESLCTRAQ